MVDAQNWMSHPGAASAIPNIFRHPQTPQTFVVRPGDEHGSIVYDVALRTRTRLRRPGPDIWQICSGGLRNRFPPRLLAVLAHLSRWLYSPRSPLNRFKRWRHMRVTPRKPEGTPNGRRLLNGSGVGLVELDAQGRPWRIRQLLADGGDVAFVPREAEAREDRGFRPAAAPRRPQSKTPALRPASDNSCVVLVVRESWLRGQDLNLRPLGYEPNELPDCSTPRLSRKS
jgi:hypothetical protein